MVGPKYRAAGGPDAGRLPRRRLGDDRRFGEVDRRPALVRVLPGHDAAVAREAGAHGELRPHDRHVARRAGAGDLRHREVAALPAGQPRGERVGEPALDERRPGRRPGASRYAQLVRREPRAHAGSSISGGACARSARARRRSTSPPRKRGAACWCRSSATVSQAYFDLRELDLELQIAKQTLTTREGTLTLFERRFEGRRGERARGRAGAGRRRGHAGGDPGPRAADRARRRT